MASIIEAQDLTRHFGDLVAVDRVSFEVQQREIFGFLGPNGAGKTTAVRMLTSVLEPTSGTATIEDHDIRTDSLDAREHLGIVPEEASVYLDLSVWRNVMLIAELHGVPRAKRRQAGSYCERAGCEDTISACWKARMIPPLSSPLHSR